MKRSLFFASAIPAATVILWLAGRACYAPSQRHEEDESWPYALGKLRDVPKRYPSHEASTNAVEVARLAEGLDVDLGQETGRRPQPPRPSRARMLRSAMRKYIVGAVNTANDDVEAPPPEIAKFLEERADALAAVRAQLNANAPPRWTSDLQELYEPPRPNMNGHGELISILATDALDRHRRGDDATAWLDLDAIWKLGRGLLAEPDWWSTASAIAAAQTTAGVAAKLSPPLPLWWRSFVALDVDRANAAAMQYETWRNLTFTRRHPAGEPEEDSPFRDMMRQGAEVVIGPFKVERAERSASSMRARAARYARTPPCAGGADSFAFPDVLWIRSRRFTVEREGITKLLALKEAHRSSGTWPPSLPAIDRSLCAGRTWSYARAADGSMRLALTPPIPRIPDRTTRLALPLEFSEGKQ